MPHLKGLQQNQMLAILPVDVQERLYPHMDLIELAPGKVLYESGDTLAICLLPYRFCRVIVACDRMWSLC